MSQLQEKIKLTHGEFLYRQNPQRFQTQSTVLLGNCYFTGSSSKQVKMRPTLKNCRKIFCDQVNWQ